MPTTNLSLPNASETFGAVYVQELVFILTTEGFSVQDGLFTKVNFLELYQEGKIANCNGQNADNPYFGCAMQQAPGQSVTDYIPVDDAGKYNLSFHLGPNEAIIMVGKTPPEVKYFSYTPFLSSRYAEEQAAHERLRIIPIRNKPKRYYSPELKREMSFSSLGDPLNNLKINTPGTPGASPGYPFEQPVVIVFTANQDLQLKIYQAALQAGFPHSCLNVVVIPKDIARLGVDDESADTFTIGNRISNNPTNPAAMDQYLQNPGFQVYRVTAPNMKGTYFPVPLLTPRGTGRTEMVYAKPVEDLRQAIVDYIKEQYPTYVPVDLRTDIWLDESYITIQQGVDNLGESRDTTYFATSSFYLPPDAFVIAYGVNHAQTGKCAYSNIVVYGNHRDNGVCTTSNEQFPGSASVYLKQPVADYLYAWKFTFNPQDQEQPYCTVIPQEDPTKPGQMPPFAIGLDEDIFFGFRAYLEPGTKTGPVWHELILDRVIVFLPQPK